MSLQQIEGVSEILEEISNSIRPHLLLYRTVHGDTLGACCADIPHLEVVDDWLIIGDDVFATEIDLSGDTVFCDGCGLPIKNCIECLNE